MIDRPLQTKRRVLLSGQDQVFSRRLAAALRLRGLGVVESPRTLELLQRLALLARRGERPDLVVLDISDNPATGAVLREVLRFEAWDLPVILVTSAAEKQALVSVTRGDMGRSAPARGHVGRSAPGGPISRGNSRAVG